MRRISGKREKGTGKEKTVGTERRKNLTRFQRAVESVKTQGFFAEEGNDETSEEEKGTQEENEEEEELELPQVIGSSLNLAKKRLKKFPEEVLEKMRQVQYLYLEGNKLTELPDDFFQKLSFLKWLDLRNNNLTSLPSDGLNRHPCLEVILLQGNSIRNLPVELATIQSLKGLQTTGNPITNVPYDVIAKGFQPTMKYLEKLQIQEQNLLPVSNAVIVKPSTTQDYSSEVRKTEPTYSELRMWDMDKLSPWRHFIKKKTEASRTILEQAKYKPVLHHPKFSVSVRSQPKMLVKPQPFRCGVYNRNRHRVTTAALRYLKMRKTALGYKRKPITVAMIQEKAKKDAYRAQVRETLEKQAKKIQRMRDKEILKYWRDHASMTQEQMKLLDNYQQYPSKDFANKTPFDVDPEFVNMLTRADLYRSLKEYDNQSKRRKKPKVKLTAQDLDRQMNEIMKKLEELDVNAEGENQSPRMKHNQMCAKMNKIMDIQKTLRNLHKLNSSITGAAPLMKMKFAT